jgi:cysteine desulfurase
MEEAPRAQTMRVYLDYNAGAPLVPEARRAMAAYLDEATGNASSIHWAGRRARAALDEARTAVAGLIGAAPGDIVFTSGGTEANNLALRGAATANGGGHIVTTAIEHASVLDTCAALGAHGCETTRVGVDRLGRIDPDAVAAAIRSETVVVSVGLANHEVGTIQPVADVSGRAHARGVLVHVDAVQAVGKMSVSVDALGADLLTLSAHKLGGPPGIGALYVRPGVALRRQLTGGPQERERRAGTENVAGAVGFAAAAQVAGSRLASEGPRQAAMIGSLWTRIKAMTVDAERNGPAAGGAAVPNTLSVTFPGADADALVIGLDLEGIAVSAGSACDAGSLRPSHVLLAMGRSPADARSALRISIGPETTIGDLARLLDALAGVVARSRGATTAEARA